MQYQGENYQVPGNPLCAVKLQHICCKMGDLSRSNPVPYTFLLVRDHLSHLAAAKCGLRWIMQMANTFKPIPSLISQEPTSSLAISKWCSISVISPWPQMVIYWSSRQPSSNLHCVSVCLPTLLLPPSVITPQTPVLVMALWLATWFRTSCLFIILKESQPTYAHCHYTLLVWLILRDVTRVNNAVSENNRAKAPVLVLTARGSWQASLKWPWPGEL